MILLVVFGDFSSSVRLFVAVQCHNICSTSVISRHCIMHVAVLVQTKYRFRTTSSESEVVIVLSSHSLELVKWFLGRLAEAGTKNNCGQPRRRVLQPHVGRWHCDIECGSG